MRLEYLKDEFPAMPKEIHDMIESEVAKQLNEDNQEKGKKKKKSWKKVAVITLVATMAVGSTVIAGKQFLKWNVEQEGNYGLKAGITGNDETMPEELPLLSIEAKYLPEGMVDSWGDGYSYHYESTPNQGGISINFTVLDEELSAEKLPVSDTYVTYFEELKINDREVIYLETAREKTENPKSKKMYIACPEYWQVIILYIGADVSKEEILKIVENMDIQPTEEKFSVSNVLTWSQMLSPDRITEFETKLTASNEEMSNVHKIGEEFVIPTGNTNNLENSIMRAKVSNVQITDDFALLNGDHVSSQLESALDENGKLIPNTINYIKVGDGINTLDETILTEQVNQKLVYVTVEYTNTGEEEVFDIIFFGSFLGLVQDENGYAFYDRAKYDGDENTNYVQMESVGCFGEMNYYDYHNEESGNNGNNHIASIKPGETIVVNMARVINEDELDKMYFSLCASGGFYEFNENALNIGYVDIRQ